MRKHGILKIYIAKSPSDGSAEQGGLIRERVCASSDQHLDGVCTRISTQRDYRCANRRAKYAARGRANSYSTVYTAAMRMKGESSRGRRIA
jgi:hypothetical protein